MQAIAHWLWHLTVANPIVVRTVYGASRRTRHFWIRSAYLLAMIVLVFFGLATAGGLKSSLGITELAKAGTSIFAFVSYAQVALICLLAPLFMAGAIGQEQAGKTYDILLTTPLTNFQIVLGSLLGRLFLIWALLASGLPLFAVLLIFGGVPVSSVFVAFAVAALVALSVGAVAVTLSVMRAGGRKAVFFFVIIIAGYLVLAYAVDLMLLRTGGTSTWLTSLHPLLVLETYLNQANYRAPLPEALAGRGALARFHLGRPFAAFATYTGVLSLGLLLWSSLFARSVVQSEGQMNWLRRMLRMNVMGEERRHAPRPVRGNPIAWREAHTRGNRTAAILARWGFLALALLTGMVLLVMLHTGKITGLDFYYALSAVLLLELAIIVMVAIYMSAGSVSAEREDGTLDLLLTTPVTPRQYIWGKLRGLVRFLTLLIAAPIATVALVSLYALMGQLLGWPQVHVSQGIVGMAAFANPLMLPEAAILLAATLIPFVAFCVIVGMNWSLKSKGVLGAVVPSVGLVGVLAMVLGFCGMSLAQNADVFGGFASALSPITNVLTVVNPWYHVSGFAANPIGGRIAMFIGAAFAAGLYSLIVYSMLGAMVKSFDQTVRKLTGTT